MLTKVHCARGFKKLREIDSIDRGSPAEVMALSIFEDLGSADTPAVAAFFADEPIGPDPIFAAIAEHKRVFSVLYDCVHTQNELEEELPRDLRKTPITVWSDDVVETDDPRWIEAQRAVFAAQDTEIAAAIELTNIMPTTRAGAIALLKYAVAFEGRGEMWPDGLEDDEGNSVTWAASIHQKTSRRRWKPVSDLEKAGARRAAARRVRVGKAWPRRWTPADRLRVWAAGYSALWGVGSR